MLLAMSVMKRAILPEIVEKEKEAAEILRGTDQESITEADPEEDHSQEREEEETDPEEEADHEKDLTQKKEEKKINKRTEKTAETLQGRGKDRGKHLPEEKRANHPGTVAEKEEGLLLQEPGESGSTV